MKYSLRLRHPSPKMSSAAWTSSSSRYSFWITSRRRCVPASGASVNPVFRTRLISVEQMRVQRVDARRRQGERDALWRDAIHQLGEERIDAAVVARAEREQRDLLVSALLEELLGVRQQRLRIALAQRAIDVACLAETTPLDATAHHLERDAVVHDVHRRDHLATEERHAVQVPDDAFANDWARGIRWDDGGEAPVRMVGGSEVAGTYTPSIIGEPGEQRAPVAAVPREIGVDDLMHDLLAVPEHHRIEEVGDRLGIEGAGTARDDQWIVRAALAREAVECLPRSSIVKMFV